MRLPYNLFSQDDHRDGNAIHLRGVLTQAA
jgi:hypothetical protein